MKDLRIIIVSWNVEGLLDRCLKSLPAACAGLDWECVVVDNASTDRSVDVVHAVGAHGNAPAPRIIANTTNVGFAKACNQGIAGYDAKYVLLLNPDTECPAGSIAELVKAADERPNVGIMGPRIIYPDGSEQQSVRKFPTVWSQAGIMLKLHHVMPWLKTFRNYFADNFNFDVEQSVDQVMGACFLVRREVIEKIGVLDERYFIWFEEVDYCRMAKDAGWEVRYVPFVSIIHHGGQSFGQVFSLKKQWMFDRSLVQYFEKWHRGWQSAFLRVLNPFALFLAWIIGSAKQPQRQWMVWLLLTLGVESVSFATIFWPIPRTVATIVFGVVMLVVAWRRPDIGLAALLLELMVGSKSGALTKILPTWQVDGGTSLRIVLTGTFLVSWFLNAYLYWGKNVRVLRDAARYGWRERLPWIILGLLVIWGVIRGVWLHQASVWKDANAWADLIVVVPVIDIAYRNGKRLMQQATSAATAALLWLPLKTIGILYVFSHGIKSLSQPIYLWVRRTGVAEATLVTGNLFRLFIQSQVYALLAFIVMVARALDGEDRFTKTESYDARYGKMLAGFILVGSTISIIIGLSRSFWIGLACGMVALLALSFFTAKKDWSSAISRTVVAGIAAFVIIFAAIAFPYPHVEIGSLTTLFGSRGSISDPAAESRWHLLPVLMKKIAEAPVLGSGFGATVTYVSSDPRILATNPTGEYTTYAFEWGWLEHWVKFGILGIPVLLWLVISLMWRLWRTDRPRWMRAGFISSLVALAILHIFTPYLNHPLGFGILMGAEALVTAGKRRA